MENHYQTLGVPTAATTDEIRRAYRILARRYHPDMNPGDTSAERFKLISEAYRILGDTKRRGEYDLELEAFTKFTGLNEPVRRTRPHEPNARKRFYEAKYQNFGTRPGEQPAPPRPPQEPPRTPGAPRSDRPAPSLRADLKQLGKKLKTLWGQTAALKEDKTSRPQPARPSAVSINKISVVEVSVTMADAITGVKKTIEISEPEGTRKVSVKLPPGVRNGSVIHLRSRSNLGEDLVIIVRVAMHPFLSLHAKGLMVEVPITVHEAIAGANISLPTLDDPIIVKVPPGAQSGTELRVKGRGVTQKDGTKGDIFYRLLIRVPETSAGLLEHSTALDSYYGASVRTELPRTLIEGL